MLNLPYSRRSFLKTTTALGISRLWLGNRSALADNFNLLGPYDREGKLDGIIHAPSDRSQWPAWREQLIAWRKQQRRVLNYSGKEYDRPEFEWVKRAFVFGFLPMWDYRFYNPVKKEYPIGAFLDEGEKQVGGYDVLLFWPAYPRIGFGYRNQFDYYRDIPYGLDALRDISDICHKRGTKVMVAYLPWDTGTRREDRSDIESIAYLVEWIDADGVFLDTLSVGAGALRQRLDRIRPGIVMESELKLPLSHVHNHHLSWAQWFDDSDAPGVLRNKWFERKHIQHQIKRWKRDHVNELQSAWMNGSGMVVWENVFGTWNPWNNRDKSILRMISPIQRRYADLFCGEKWTPLVDTLSEYTYASLWEADGLRLWTMVNRSDKAILGSLLDVPHREGDIYYDLIDGTEVKDTVKDGKAYLPGLMHPNGIAAFVAAKPKRLGDDFDDFLKQQYTHYRQADFANLSEENPQIKLLPPKTELAKSDVPESMVYIGGGEIELPTETRLRECGLYDVDGGPEWDMRKMKLHSIVSYKRNIGLRPYAIDRTPVTNAEFFRFMQESGYVPEDSEYFLEHWKDKEKLKSHRDHPVVYISLEDARAYAEWAGKRLPTEEEWQYAAQGPEELRYPWGNKMRDGMCNDGSNGDTTSVTAYPNGRSAFGCYDMCGNVWEWTESERSDGKTRFCILKGGSYFQAKGSDWYADGGPQPNAFAAKFILSWPGADRCATIGFRCAVDIKTE